MNTFVKNGDRYLVQLDADNQFGFVLADEYDTWPGGFGSGMPSWKAVETEDVPQEDRDRMEWLLRGNEQ
ncbi:MAG: hypothetical protein KJ558_10000 [Gammaproteobacteria bacterium]|nr:hypothetical protein [Gammaproteobacteria bacterium]MBU1959680.1 hypothetical protein [Gammaproteobacteria bacterium]